MIDVSTLNIVLSSLLLLLLNINNFSLVRGYALKSFVWKPSSVHFAAISSKLVYKYELMGFHWFWNMVSKYHKGIRTAKQTLTNYEESSS